MSLRSRRIRILVVSNFYPPWHCGGYELRCRMVVDRLRARGHAVRVLTGRWRARRGAAGEPHVTRALHVGWGPPFPPEDLVGLVRSEASDRAVVRRLAERFRPDVIDVWGMEFASQSLVDELAGGPVPVHLTLEDVWLCRTWRFDPLLNLAACGRELGVPPPPALAGLCRPALAPPDVSRAEVTFVSQALARRYAKAGFAPAHARVRLAGIDVERFERVARREAAAPGAPTPLVILSVGRLSAPRGQADLIAACADAVCHPSVPPVLLRIVGTGPTTYRRALESLAARHANRRLHIEFAGAVDASEMPRVYGEAHLFVHASRLPEGLPVALMEALASGLPAIATDSGGQRDVLGDGRWGELVPAGDVTALSRAIRDAAGDWRRWTARAAAARTHARRRFGLEGYVDGHVDDLLRAIARRAAVAGTGARPAPARERSGARADTLRPARAWRETLGPAASAAAKTLEPSADPERAWRIGVVLKRCGRTGAARRLFARLMAVPDADGTNVRRSAFHLAELALIERRFAEAAGHLKRCLAVAQDHLKAQYDLRCARRRVVPAHLRALAGARAARRGQPAST